MLHLTRAIDRATGYVFVPPPTLATLTRNCRTDTNAPSSCPARIVHMLSSPVQLDPCGILAVT